MYVIVKDRGFVFSGYLNNGNPQWERVGIHDIFIHDSFSVKIFLSESAAVVEGNYIQEDFQIPVRVIPFSEWIEKNKIGGM